MQNDINHHESDLRAQPTAGANAGYTSPKVEDLGRLADETLGANLNPGTDGGALST